MTRFKQRPTLFFYWKFGMPKIPGQNIFEIRRYFSKITGNSADTAVDFLKTADAPLS